MKVLRLIGFAALWISGSHLAAQSSKDTSITASKAILISKDNPIVAALDSLSVVKCFQKSDFTADNKTLNIYKYADGFVPSFSDST